MSTRSFIGIRDNNKVKYIYCHFDGYPGGVGDTLMKYYTDEDKVNTLINFGNHSTLNQQPDDGSYVKLGENYVDNEPHVVSYSEWLKQIDTSLIDYFYLFDDNVWHLWNFKKTRYNDSITWYNELTNKQS